MKDTFYIIETQTDWFHLRMKENHYCFSAGQDLNRVVHTLRELVLKYKTKERLLRAMACFEDGGRIARKTFEIYEKEYELHGDRFEDLVEDTVHQALKEVAQNSGYNKVKKLVKRVVTPTEPVVTPPVQEEITSLPALKKGLLLRPKLVSVP